MLLTFKEYQTYLAAKEILEKLRQYLYDFINVTTVVHAKTDVLREEIDKHLRIYEAMIITLRKMHGQEQSELSVQLTPDDIDALLKQDISNKQSRNGNDPTAIALLKWVEREYCYISSKIQ